MKQNKSLVSLYSRAIFSIKKLRLLNCSILLSFLFGNIQVGMAGPKEQADRIFQRLNGVPSDLDTLNSMTKMIEDGNLAGAALMAIEDPNGRFYNITLKNWWAPFTNEGENARVPLNDYTALAIGMVRDEIPFDQILYGDILYIAVDPSSAPLPDYDQKGDDEANAHFLEVEKRRLPLHKVLKKVKQSDYTSYAPDVAAGALTTWGFSKDYYNAGTNRAAFRFTSMTYLCRDMEQLHDPTRSDYRIRRDVPRDPGGDSTVFRTKCAGCHAGMDALAGAFSYWNYDDELGVIYDPTNIPEKINRNGDVFPNGFVTTDDSWLLLWHQGPNKKVGWNGARSGKGVKSLGKMLSSTDAFARCISKRVLKLVCEVDGNKPEHTPIVEQLAHSFKQPIQDTRYNLKHLFAKTAIICRGQ